ncbi:putative nuclease HARBI1 [Monomorium pharaonis]|uniref:putative nuclease HARBI1 n=1 Tax=Monomorium pharaonis TaxID=307658 RepID=UPI00063FD0BF|nr:putative nuclease HARBI1 [Monomorium pharaonis]
MKRTTFIFLLELLTPHLSKQSDNFGRHSISPEKQLLLSIWIMATPNSYRCVNDRFGVGRATAWRSIQKVISALYYYLHTFIKWPSIEEARATWTFIKNKYGFPKVIDAIDGTHIPIAAPKNNSECYINRKGYHSIQLQVICDSNLKFLHCYAGQVGSVHDMRVFRLSRLQTMFTEDNFPENSLYWEMLHMESKNI